MEAKGFDRLVSSAYKLHKEGYEFEVWILGQGEGKNDIGQYIKENQMQDYFKLKGFQENPYPYIQAADALICSYNRLFRYERTIWRISVRDHL